ncbi:hypothetical protein QBC41DRAFT_331889 [Cercophora samala]|uniref:Transmembrane protein n=1 Tax=Cercophora samala TaxID=330535 RepID=A0AA40D0P1_9PEZI|nr:hypothetical protein QBC41DRAFT_331889 [Cercophora samala]
MFKMDDWEEKSARETFQTLFVVLFGVHCIIGLMAGASCWAAIGNPETKQKDGCLRFGTFFLCILVGLLWPLVLLLTLLGHLFCDGANTCCGMNCADPGKLSPKPAQTPVDVEGQTEGNNVVDEQPGPNENIALPPYPGPVHLGEQQR